MITVPHWWATIVLTIIPLIIISPRLAAARQVWRAAETPLRRSCQVGNQSNCLDSVDPTIASVEERPPVVICITSSK